MAIRLTGTFKSPATAPFGPDVARTYRVDIYDADFSGEASEAIILAFDVLWESDKQEDRHAPMIGSRASLSINIPATDSTLTTFIEDLAYAEDGRFLMEVTRDAGVTTIWRGIVKPDQSGEDDIDPFTFKISAICGLASLKTVPFLFNATTYYQLRYRFTRHIVNCLAKMAHAPNFWTSGDVCIRTSVDWWSTAMASGANDDALYQSGCGPTAFYNANSDGPIEDSVMNCYDVLAEIMRTFGCRLYQSEGVWRVEQIPYRTAEYYYTRDYDIDGDFISSVHATGVNTINQTILGAKLTLVNYDFLPILKRARVFYNAKKRNNILNGNILDEGSDTIIFDQFIDSLGGTAIVRVRGLVSYSIESTGYTGGSTDKIFIVPSLTLKIGGSYLRRNYTISNYTANLAPAVWNLTSSNRVYLPHLAGTVPSIGSKITGYYGFEVLSGALPLDGGENQLFCGAPELFKWNGIAIGGGLDVTWSISGIYVDIFDSGVVTDQEDQVCFEAVNPAEAVEKYDIHLKVGNSDSEGNTAGRIFYTPDETTWTPADIWGQGVDPRTSHICDILALNILNGQISPRRRMNGSFYGNFRNFRLMSTSDGRKWMFTRLKWDFTQNIMNGSWVELDYGAEGVSSTPIKIKAIKGSVGFPAIADPANPNGLSNGNHGFSINTSPAVLAPVSYNALATEILVGDTVTSIPIKIASAGNEFLAGDSVGLVDPYTGQFQYFEIATAPAAGDTSLSVVSDTSLYDFPEDSYLVISQKPYAFTPGNWYTFKGTITTNKVIVTGFTLPVNDDACFCIVRRQVYQSPDDFTINYGDNSVNFLSSLGLNGQIAYVKAYA